MNIPKSLLAGAFALVLAGVTHAQTKIYITGSTAFRSATNAAIDTLLAGTGTLTKASNNSNFGSADAVTYSGGSIGGQPVTIKTSYSGSAAGIQTVAGAPNFNVRFLPDGATGTANPDPRNTNNPAESAVPDLTLADNYQASSFFIGNSGGVNYATLNDEIVGVVTFRWIASNGFPQSQSMSPQLAQYLLGSGTIPLALFTGASADRTKLVYATGRDPDSGTRIVTFSESGVGAFSVVKQYKPVFDTTDTSLVVGQDLYPVQFINGVSTQFPGNGGESSGSTLRSFTNKTLTQAAYRKNDPNQNSTAGFYVTYMGTSDANTVLNTTTNAKPAVALRWNGVDFSTDAVIDGSYTFWGYLHLMRGNLTGTKLTFSNGLRDTLLATPTSTLSPNVRFGDMQVSRSADGGPISANYF